MRTEQQYCETCETWHRHDLLGQNMIGRPIWECHRCGATRAGPFPSTSQPVATDGGNDAK